MLIYLRVLKESFNFAINALINNKLRTFLSLLGVTIGIFSIIAVLAAVDSLKKEIEGSISSLDNSTIYLGRFSFGPTSVPRWKTEQFPDVTYDEYQLLKKIVPDMYAASYLFNLPASTMKFEERSVSSVGVVAITHEYYDIEALDIDFGRFFNESENASGVEVAVIGAEIAKILFDSSEAAIGKKVRLYGRKFIIIGVLEKEGSGLFGESRDTAAYVPVNSIRKIFGSNNRNLVPFIIIKPDVGVDQAEFVAVLAQKLRMARGLKPDEIDNFFVNELQGFADLIDNITSNLNIMGLIISGFSLLVGGFGIANIMFVSVKERTNLIGIQKSLGAKNKFILFQFLFEAMILSIIGGLIGLVLVFVVSILASQLTGDFEFVLSLGNIFIGTAVSAVIGLIAGILPAISASRLDPVEAIRTGM
jgi:putative ABC transport system permease protein